MKRSAPALLSVVLLCAGAVAQFSPVIMAPAVPDVTAVREDFARINVKDFGAVGDGKVDDAAAVDKAVAAAAAKGEIVYFPPGQYRFASAPKPMGAGIVLLGGGSMGSTPGYGTYLIADYDEKDAKHGFLTWDGSYSRNAGTGGGIERISVSRATGRAGGTAIKLTGSNDHNRAGFFTIRDVLVSGTAGTGTWDHLLLIDGSCCTTAQSQGIRDVYIVNFWGADSTAADQAVLMNNAVQVFWFGGELYAAAHGSSVGVTVTGGDSATSQSTNIFLVDVYIAGDLKIDNARTVSFTGLVGGNLDVGSTASEIDVRGFVSHGITNHSSSAQFATNQGWESPSIIHAGPAPSAISGGDVSAARNATSGAVWLGSDGKGYIYRRTPDRIDFSVPIRADGLSAAASSGSDLAGELHLSAGRAVYSFKARQASAPFCTAADTTAAKAVQVKVTPSELEILGSGNDLVDYICVGRE